MIVYPKNTRSSEKINANKEFNKEDISKINLQNEKFPMFGNKKFVEMIFKTTTQPKI